VKKGSNHREFITHYPAFYLLLLLVASSLSSILLIWLFLGTLFHLVFDWFDWGLPVFPFTKKNISTPHLLQEPSFSNNEIEFFKIYWTNKIILFIELVLLFGFVLSFFYIPTHIFLLIVGIDIFLTLEIILNLRKTRQN
jgi:hypothetical protein